MVLPLDLWRHARSCPRTLGASPGAFFVAASSAATALRGTELAGCGSGCDRFGGGAMSRFASSVVRRALSSSRMWRIDSPSMVVDRRSQIRRSATRAARARATAPNLSRCTRLLARSWPDRGELRSRVQSRTTYRMPLAYERQSRARRPGRSPQIGRVIWHWHIQKSAVPRSRRAALSCSYADYQCPLALGAGTSDVKLPARRRGRECAHAKLHAQGVKTEASWFSGSGQYSSLRHLWHRPLDRDRRQCDRARAERQG